MLKLDHITVIAPTLAEGVSHVKNCLDIDVPFGTRHDYMGTHNHRLQLGNDVYLEIVALDPDGTEPGRSRWFGLGNQKNIRSDWDRGRRFRGWVASTVDISAKIAAHRNVWEYPKLCVWGLAHAGFTGHLLNRSGYRIENWLRAATHSLTHLPVFSNLRIAR